MLLINVTSFKEMLPNHVIPCKKMYFKTHLLIKHTHKLVHEEHFNLVHIHLMSFNFVTKLFMLHYYNGRVSLKFGC